MADIGELRYDRTVSSEFAQHFAPAGFAASLVDYARGKYPIDFQYRKDPKTGRQWATLYVGLTAVLNVEDKRSKGLALSAHPTYKTRPLGWRSHWSTPAESSHWMQEWPDVEAYLERVIPKVITDGRYVTTEGVVQAVVSGYLGDPSRVILDREVTPYFRDTPGKRAVQELYSGQIKAALAARISAPAPARHFGMECDALAIDSTGRLVAIEIKPGSVGSLAWVAAQATMYARVLQHWVDRDTDWRDIIKKTFAQREDLGLVPPGFVLPKLKPVVVPAVAMQRVASQKYVEQMYAVHDALAAEKVAHPDMVFYAVAPSGRLEEHQRP
jgi:hypothetical protein